MDYVPGMNKVEIDGDVYEIIDSGNKGINIEILRRAQEVIKNGK